MTNHSKLWAAAVALALAGCATTQSSSSTAASTPTTPTQKTAAASTSAPAKTASAEAPEPDGPKLPQINGKALRLFDDANKAYAQQRKAKAPDWASVERRYHEALDADPNLAEAEYDLGVIAEQQGKTDEASDHYRSALQKRPSLKAAGENLAVILQNKGDTAGAQRLYEQISQLFPDDASSRARLAELARQAGEHDRAMDLSRQALMREPKLVAAYKVMMLSLLDRKQLSMAKLVALRALKIDSSDPELYNTVGLVLAREGESEKAAAQFKKAVDARPDYLPALVQLARIAMKDENYGAAAKYLGEILSVNARNAEAHLDLGVAYKGAGQFDKALQEYDVAEQLNPKLPGIYLNRAIILQRYKDSPEQAISLYKKYIQMVGAKELAADDKVFALQKEAETLAQAKVEAAKAMEQAKKMEEEQKKKGPAPTNDVKPASGTEGASPAPTPAAASTDGQSAAPAKSGKHKKGHMKDAAADEPKDATGT